MRLETTIVREPRERPLPRTMLSPIRAMRGRPKERYRPVVRTAEDVARLRRRRLPMFLLTDEWVTRSGYPTQFRPWLAVSQSIAKSVQSGFRLLPVRDDDALEHPQLPELVTLLLRFDPLAARAVALRNRAKLDPNELYRRVRNEHLEAAATRVRLQEVSPTIPVVGEALPLDDLTWVDENNPAMDGAR